MGYTGRILERESKNVHWKRNFKKNYPKALINGVTQERYENVKPKNRNIFYLQKISITKMYPKDRINDSTQERCSETKP